MFFLLILFLPTQLGLHFWPNFSSVLGIRVDYLSPTIYFTDIFIILLFTLSIFRKTLKAQRLRNIRSSEAQNVRLSGIPSIPSFLKKHNFLYFKLLTVIIFLIFNILLSSRIEGGLYSLLKLAEMSFVAYYIAKFIDLKKVSPKIIVLLSTGVIAQSIIAIFQYLVQGSIGGFLYYLGERTFNASTPGIANASLNGELVLRSYGTFPHPNVLAGYLVVVMILILFSVRNKKPNKVFGIKYLVLSIISLILGTIALLLSMSRVAIVLWILIIGYYIFQKTRKTQQAGSIRSPESLKARSSGALSLLSVPGKITLFGMLIVLTLFFLSPIGARFTKIANTDEAIVQRTTLIDSSIKMIEKSPILGVGLGNFIPTLATIQKPLSLGLYLQPVHNIFLLVAAETGLIGLGLFTWFLWKTYRAPNGKWQTANGISFSFLAILTLGLFDHYWLTLQQGQLLFAFVIGLCWANIETSKH